MLIFSVVQVVDFAAVFSQITFSSNIRKAIIEDRRMNPSSSIIAPSKAQLSYDIIKLVVATTFGS
jgi:hypothetical protein